MAFPIDINKFVKMNLTLKEGLSDKELKDLSENIELMRDAIVATTAFARAKGIGGHTGGPYDIVPEVIIADALRDGGCNGHSKPLANRRNGTRGQEEQHQIPGGSGISGLQRWKAGTPGSPCLPQCSRMCNGGNS